jgi:signal transduction histidine kinase
MRISHRARLTIVSAGSAGIVLLAIFGVSTFGLRNAELQAALGELDAAIAQVVSDMGESGRPDLAEVAASNPEIGLAVFDPQGNLILRDGRVTPPLISQSGLVDGLVVRSRRAGQVTVVAGESWSKHDALLHSFELLCAALWLPLVGIIALATWVAARATFLPLEQMASEAEALSVESLSSRLHVETSGEYREFGLRLNRFLDKLESSLRREERFLSDAAHELRTPLTVLRGQIETALLSERSAQHYRDTLKVLLEETCRLSNLAELLLRSAAPIHSEGNRVDLAEAAERAHARWVDRFAQKGVELELIVSSAEAHLADIELDVLADNLLTNCLNASSSGSVCGIVVEGLGGSVRFRVRDQGPGIPANEAERIFERFARADAGRARADGGFGIGLALCKGIAEARGGRIWVEPNEPRGSNFVIEFPAA